MITFCESIYKTKATQATSELFHKTLDSADVVYNKIASSQLTHDDLQELKKKSLPVFCYMATFSNGRRQNASAVSTGFVMLDYDDCDAQGAWGKVSGIAEREQIALAHITPSGKGLRLVVDKKCCVNEKIIKETQEHFNQLLALKADIACKDLARASYAPSKRSILYVNEGLLFRQEVFPNEPAEQAENAATPEAEEEAKKEPATLNLSYNGVALQDICKELVAVYGGDPAVGTRNITLYRIASDMRLLCDNSEDVLYFLLPRFGLQEKEFKGVIKSATKEPVRRSFGAALKKAIEAAAQKVLPYDDDNSAETPPSMPKKLPFPLNVITRPIPEIYKAAASCSVFPALGAHLYGTTFRYVDGIKHEATFMSVLMAGSSAGKSCANFAISHVMDDIRAADAINYEREKQWKEANASKGANKDKDPRPDDIIIQEIDPDMTNPAFVMRLSQAKGRFLYCTMNEIEQFDALRSGRGSKGQFQIMCLAFDPDNRYGQTRVGLQSVSDKVQIRFNWHASTTINKGVSYFKDVVDDGPISRISFSTIPERPIGAAMPIYGEYTEDDIKSIATACKRLTDARGTISCPQAIEFAKRLLQEAADVSRQTYSRKYETLSFRAIIIAYLKACVLYLCNGSKWTREISDYCKWSFRYDMFLKIKFFSEFMAAEQKVGSPQAKNLLSLLPDEFTTEDVQILRKKEGLSPSIKKTNIMLRVWKSRGFIIKVLGKWKKA